MDIEFDAAKDCNNLQKHGVSLREAAGIEWETLYAMEDQEVERYAEA